MKFEKLGLIGRFKPLHLGGAGLLEEACKQSSEVIIGIGSANKYDLRNPFTAQESEDMIRACIKSPNYEILYIPDFGHIPGYESGQEWAGYIKSWFGELDAFVSGNLYVTELLKPSYKIIHPNELIPREKQIELHATKVRIEMANGEGWRDLVPDEVEHYIDRNGLLERFRKEYGSETLQKIRYKSRLSARDEREIILGGGKS